MPKWFLAVSPRGARVVPGSDPMCALEVQKLFLAVTPGGAKVVLGSDPDEVGLEVPRRFPAVILLKLARRCRSSFRQYS